MPFWFHPKRCVYSTANSRDLSRCDSRFYEHRTPLRTALWDSVDWSNQLSQVKKKGCKRMLTAPIISSIFTTLRLLSRWNFLKQSSNYSNL